VSLDVFNSPFSQDSWGLGFSLDGFIEVDPELFGDVLDIFNGSQFLDKSGISVSDVDLVGDPENFEGNFGIDLDVFVEDSDDSLLSGGSVVHQGVGNSGNLVITAGVNSVFKLGKNRGGSLFHLNQNVGSSLGEGLSQF
jgi:hypothetical protein